jgi:type II secretory pathway predicted ATPase ExeA
MPNTDTAIAPMKLQRSLESDGFGEPSSIGSQSVNDLLTFFSVREHPFGATPDPRFLFESGTHRQAFENLVAGIEAGDGFQTLTAKPGMGKTTVIRRLLRHYEDSASTAFLFQTQCDSREFLQYLCMDLGIDPSMANGIIKIHERIRKFLVTQRRLGRRVLVVVDEAQNLENTVLETIRLLSNFETFDSKLLQIILVGQTQLMQRLGSPELLQLLQRVSKFNRLETLTFNEITEYIGHRLKIADYSGGELFTPSAIGLIASQSGGVPRAINTICSTALVLAHRARQKTVGAAIIKKMVEQLDLVNSAPERGHLGLLSSFMICQTTDQDQLTLQKIVHQLQVATGATGAAIALGSKENMVCRAQSGASGPEVGSLINVQSGLSGEAVRTSKVIVCNDVEKDLRTDQILCKTLNIRSLAVMPLVNGGEINGIVGIFSDRKDTFQFRELGALKRAVGRCTAEIRGPLLQILGHR